eukprot:scaffold111791_cov25-Prasinocladus_malaysianus.AAC.2
MPSGLSEHQPVYIVDDLNVNASTKKEKRTVYIQDYQPSRFTGGMRGLCMPTRLGVDNVEETAQIGCFVR